MRFTCLGSAAGMVKRERKVQWTSVGWGQAQGRGQGGEAAAWDRVMSTIRARKTRTADGSIFIRRAGGGVTAVRVKTIPRMNITRDDYSYCCEASFMETVKYCGGMLVRNLI